MGFHEVQSLRSVCPKYTTYGNVSKNKSSLAVQPEVCIVLFSEYERPLTERISNKIYNKYKTANAGRENLELSAMLITGNVYAMTAACKKT